MLLCICLSLSVGCDKEDDENWEIYPNSNNKVIEKEIDGIVFKFCLLDENGLPQTTFKEKENFSFYFSVKNNRNEKLYFYPGFAYSNENDFCKVYSRSENDNGRPYIFKGADLIGTGAYPIDSGEICVFKQSWSDNRISTWKWKFGNYESAGKELLISGDYFTRFQYYFQFERTDDKPILRIDTLRFKINFKIQ
jgi:hypothetical protein